ncbi:MAG: 6-aminohexanoate hydrolase [Actinomycetia bacterium]|nr:6-aminohexanoate hydrolase [Actinomycetes bacterium]
MTDLAALDATAQAELVRTGEVSPKELVAAAIERIERTNPALNAVIHERFDKAMAEVDGVDRSTPFAGVPYLAKDAGCATEGDPYHVGLGPLKAAGFRAPADSELATRFRRAGFVCVGRTNVPQLLVSATTEPLAYGPTRNPWDTERSSGGSSGGSGAAVGAGMVPLAHGNDAGGSIRIPATCCGLVGLKPTRARVSDGPSMGETWGGLNHEFAVTRSVRDTAALLDALAGRAWGDPYAAPLPARPWSQEVGADPGRLRIRVVTDLDRMAVDPEIAAAVRATAALLSDLGHDVADVQLPELEEDSGYGAVVAVSIARDVERLAMAAGVAIDTGDLEPMPGMILAGGRAMTGVQYQAALEQMHAYSRRLEARWADFDLLLTPTVAVQQAHIGEMAPLADLAEAGPKLGARTAFTAQFDASGQPAISLPLHQTAAGLPIGSQLVAATGGEDLLLRVAAQLEATLPWADRRPSIFG